MAGDRASECRSWTSIADLLGGDRTAPIAILGAPLAERSLTPGRCDMAPRVLRETLARISSYDLGSESDLGDLAIFDAGDLDLKLKTPLDSFEPIRSRMAALMAVHELVFLLGGNNAVTRPGVHGMGGDLARVGLLTLDAHFDLRDTDCGLTNGNPVAALLEDGLPGAHIAQIGLAPFANTRRMHERAHDAGITVYPLGEIRTRGIEAVVDEALETLAGRCDAIYVDFDIDVIARHEAPGAPGARPGGLSAAEFFAATRRILAQPKVRGVDLAEFDPSLDVSDITALTAARWVAECLAGFKARSR